MMLFKLSISNMKKSMKDYTIYFLTLILGVAIFYMFNSLDAQKSMMVMSSSTYTVVELLITLLGGVSVFIAIVLAFLIVYANNFLMKRRKREFGIYMTLGMGKGQISRILVGETILIGLLSLAVGLAAGIFGSQFMSILVAKMFEADMESFAFVFSSSAFFKTILYFGIMYLAVMVFNTVMISRYPLIRLIHADKQGEKMKLKNSFVCVGIFIVSASILAYAYYQVWQPQILTDFNYFLKMIFLGMIATFGIFWSLSGFLIKMVQTIKFIYLKGLHPFVLRQVGSQVNTMTVSMTVICLLLFLTICIFSGSFAMNESMKRELKECARADVNVTKLYGENSPDSIEDSMQKDGFDLSVLQDGWAEVHIYNTELTGEDVLGTAYASIKQDEVFLSSAYRSMDLIKVSDYNKLAEIYNMETCFLGENEYQVVADYDLALKYYEEAAKNGTEITLNGKTYHPVSDTVLEGLVKIYSNRANEGVLILPDEALEGITWENEGYSVFGIMAANYIGETEQEKQENENAFLLNVKEQENNSFLSLHGLSAMTKQALYAASVGLSSSIIFLGIYLGIVFLISSAALLALKVLSESTDNRSRYMILRKIGADERMIHRALLEQSAFYFLLPLALASVHSIFGLKVADSLLRTLGKSQMILPIIMTAILLLLVYGGYFLITYWGSKRIIRDR